MYLQIKKICYFFEKLSDTDRYYFNDIDYKFYSEEERQGLIISKTYEASDFFLIPQLYRNEIVKKYLSIKNNQNLLRKIEDKDFYRKFHWYIEDNHLVDDWNHFEQLELISFAAEWSKQNQRKFTMK